MLETLNLSGNLDGDEGVTALAHAHSPQAAPPIGAAPPVRGASDVGALALLQALGEPIGPPLEALVLDANPAVSDLLKAALAAAPRP